MTDEELATTLPGFLSPRAADRMTRGTGTADLAVVYLRVRYGSDYPAFVAQRDRCHRAADGLGARIIAEYNDFGGTEVEGRPGLEGLLARLSERPAVAYVIVASLDRLARSFDMHKQVNEAIVRNGAVLIEANGTHRANGSADAGFLQRLRALAASGAASPNPGLSTRRMDHGDVGRVIAEYDATVRANTTPCHNAMRAVADDDQGEVRWEVIETAERLGYPLDDRSLDQLHEAADIYRERLAADLRAGDQSSSQPPADSARVELVRTTDPHTHLEPGATGTVRLVDRTGTVHIRWDDGSTLGLIPGVDQWRDLP